MTKKWIFIASSIIIGLIILDQWSKSKSNYDSKNSNSYYSTNSTNNRHGPADVSAYVKMSTVFIGSPSQQKIKNLLEPVMRLHDMDINEDNLIKCADVLVALRKSSEGKISEIEILDYMNRSKIDQISFGDHAAIAFTFITTGNSN